MSAIQYLSAFRTFGADVLALALGVTLVTSLFKKTVFKNRSKKLFVFLPFALGFVFYAVYRAIAARSAIPFTGELFRTCEGGFACGCAATLYYVVYEQFFRNLAGETMLSISHRLSSCRLCDRILVFHEGRIVQSGTHRELLADETGKYYKLWHAQAQYYA